MKCQTFEIASILGKKWTIPLLQEVVLNGDKGFNLISKRMFKISPKILSRRLKDLEKEGIIEREVIDNKIPIRAKYRLTGKGQELYNLINSLKAWNIKHSKEKINCNEIDCVKCPVY